MPAGADAPEDKLGGLASQVIILHTNIIPGKKTVIVKISVADPNPCFFCHLDTDPGHSVSKQK